MICTYCSNKITKVLDKRDSVDSPVSRRRRECTKCKKRFTTYERVETISLLVIKRDGRKEHFDRSKLERGIRKALQKRPVDDAKIDKIVSDIEIELINCKSSEVHSKEIGELVLNRLKSVDSLGYIRFASVYKEFKNLEDLKKEVLELSEGK